jgi:hypothetical protein
MTILRHLHRCPKVKRYFATCPKLGHFREHGPKMPEKQTIFQSVTAYNKNVSSKCNLPAQMHGTREDNVHYYTLCKFLGWLTTVLYNKSTVFPLSTFQLYVETFLQHLHIDYISLSWYDIQELVIPIIIFLIENRGVPPLKLEKIWFFGVKSWFFTRNTPKFSHLPLQLEIIWFFGVKSWFFTRNTQKFSRPPPLGAIFLSAPP